MQSQSTFWPLNLGWPKKISPHVYLLGNYHFNVYLVQGEDCALVETGMGCSAGFVIKQVEQLGIPKEKIKYILAMHAHPDHSTGIPFLLAAFPAAQVAASAEAQKVLSRDTVRAFFKEDEDMSNILAERGEINQIPPPPPRMEMPVHLTVGEGDFLDLGDGVRVEHYKESLRIYTLRNIRGCAENLIKRAQEELGRKITPGELGEKVINMLVFRKRAATRSKTNPVSFVSPSTRR